MSDEIFNLAVSLIRKGDSFVDIIREIEAQGPPGVDAMAVYGAAREYAEKSQKAAFECAVEAFKNGESRAIVESKLRQCGFHSWDAMLVASRAEAEANTVQEQK